MEHLFRHRLASKPARGSEVASPSAARWNICGKMTLAGRWYSKYDETSSGLQNVQLSRVEGPNLRYICRDLCVKISIERCILAQIWFAYIGVVSLVFRASSALLSSPPDLSIDSRVNKTSDGICKREPVAAKMFCSKLPFRVGRLKKTKKQMQAKRTFSPRVVSFGKGRGGGRVRTAVFTAR